MGFEGWLGFRGDNQSCCALKLLVGEAPRRFVLRLALLGFVGMDTMGFVSTLWVGGKSRRVSSMQERRSVLSMVATQGRPTKFEAMRKKYGAPERSQTNAGFSYAFF